MRTRYIALTLALLCAWATALTQAATRFVDTDATGANTGTSWADAYTDLQSALSVAVSGDQIWVAEGAYAPGPPSDASSSFVMREGVALCGGFAGDETALQQRDWNAHPTILSGDVGHDDVYEGGFWPQGWYTTTANSGHVVVGSGVGPDAILDGFTITGGATGPSGTPAGDPLMFGGGLYVIAGSPTVRNCTFTYNRAAFAAGGAIYCQDASPNISHCGFVRNLVHLGNGGAIAVTGNAVPTISDCTFSENHAICADGNTGQGAALSINFLTAPASATVTRCTFEYNQARNFYPVGGIEIARGGGISNFGATLTVRDCIFRYNSAPAGAGIQTWNPATIINSLFHNNTVYSRDYSNGASDGGYGAAVCIYAFQPHVATIVNCTIVDNTGAEGVGLQSLQSAQFTVRNAIIWGNFANGEDVSPRDAGIKGNYSARYSCIQDLLTPIPGEDPPDPGNYPGCFMLNPQFVTPTDRHLAAGSPCIDAGRNADVPAGVTTDLDGRSRFYDDPAAPNVGSGTPPLVDMGAYERQPLLCAGDMDCDGDVDFFDIDPLVLAFSGQSAYLANYPNCQWFNGDLDHDNDVDFFDIDPFVAQLGASCP